MRIELKNRVLQSLLCIGILLLGLFGSAHASNRVAGTLTLVPQNIRLTDIDMVLREAVTQQVVAKATTRLDGKFSFEAPKPGVYVACWKVSGITGCTGRIFVKQHTTYLGVVSAKSEGRLITGTVLNADQRACWVNDPFFKLDVSTQLTLLDLHGNVLRKGVRANVAGQYAIGGVSAGRYDLTAECEKSNTKARVSVGGTSPVVNLTLPNHAPTIASLGVYDGTIGLSRAAAGSTVRVQAVLRDKDQDPVEYLWRTLDGYGTITGTNAAQQDWNLPSKPGLYAVYLMARDGKGGYAYKRMSLTVGAPDVPFSGRVIDETTQAPVGGATVNVSGKTATTNAQGWFDLNVPPQAPPERYVVNISHPQYAQQSHPFDKSVTGATYELIRAQVTSHDPTQDIKIVDAGSSGPCGTPGGKAVSVSTAPGKDNTTHTAAVVPNRTQKREKACRHIGAQVVIPAGALVDADQRAPQGQVTMALATLNPARRSLPGDYRAQGSNGVPAELESFGAVYAEFRDAAGKLLNLKPGAVAQLRVPVSAAQKPNAKPTIAMWSYEEKTGLWLEEGKATLKNTPQGWAYVGNTKHFSTINMDVAGSDPNFATCVRLQTGNSLSGWGPLTLRAYVSYNGTSVQVKETVLDSDQYHAIYRIPYTAPAFPPTTLRMQIRGAYNGQQVVLLDKIINTDVRETALRTTRPGPLTELWPTANNYEVCGDAIVLEADPITLPDYGDIDASGRPAFLNGPYGVFLPEDGEQVATDYYNAIAGAAKSNLGDWWTANTFAADGSGGTRAAYLNHNDLGFGRDMNCKKSGSDLACYVTNYGLPDQNLQNADDAENRTPGKRGATVTMEYKNAAALDRRVTFYVYGGGDASAPRIKFADLDGMGPKSVPHLCLVCHGGSPVMDPVTKEATFARFREFDLPSFKYSGSRSWDFAPAVNTLTAAESNNFGALNQMVRDTQPPTSAVKSLINAWYPGGVFTVPPTKPAVPSGWSVGAAINGQSPAQVVNDYHKVYGQSCRTCHIARDEGDATAFILFDDANNFAGATASKVCGSPKVMPNAFVTYKNFWTDLQRVIDYRALTGRTVANCQ
ncbi:carboxypeptidase regulatory-like domain-containing protein [Propionivibrio sp.]|uniref:carboxypeptidase regulatory-like domain-containing protein n=1 Tax=Propionivibrio sp. TaxID=2212460 RepID=UPI0026360EA5|nr:carboxypeptidase regulatory-like domain-containing protein [Propionivibrio sp.]